MTETEQQLVLGTQRSSAKDVIESLREDIANLSALLQRLERLQRNRSFYGVSLGVIN